MIPELLWVRLQNFIKVRLGVEEFRARSLERDAETDQSRIGSIVAAIETALHSAQREQSGLSRRVENVLARASVTIGSGTDEYLERDPQDSHHQDLFDDEIRNGQRRLNELTSEIAHFKFMKAVVLTRFPGYAPAARMSTG